MRSCFKTQTTSEPQTTSPSTQHSPTKTLTLTLTKTSLEYSNAIQTPSFTTIWTSLQSPSTPSHLLHSLPSLPSSPLHLAYSSKTLTLTRLCLDLNRSIHLSKSLYSPLLLSLDLFPSNSPPLSSPQRAFAFQNFLAFHSFPNPFPDASAFDAARNSFNGLRIELDSRIRKSKRKLNLFYGCGRRRRRKVRIEEMDAAAMGAFVMDNDVDTMERLVAGLREKVEGDKRLVGMVVERGYGDRHPVEQVLKWLRTSCFKFEEQLKGLEEHICLCFATINRATVMLLKHIQQEQ